MNLFSHQRGVVFLTALVAMIILFNLGIAYVMSTRTEIETGKNFRNGMAAFYYAESALAHSLAELKNAEDGNIPSTDLDGDGIIDYMGSYSIGTKEVFAFGGDVSGQGIRRFIQALTKQSPWTGAMQIGTTITANTGNTGVVNGNVDAKGNINMQPQIVVNGTTTANHTTLQFPNLNIASYQAIANYTYSGWPTWNTNPAPGIHYVSGNLTISGINNFNLDGSIIVTGTLNFSSMTGSMTITSSGSSPALIAGTSLTMTSTWRPNITGLVYAGASASFSSINGPGVINGAIVAKLGGLTMTNVNNLTVNFDPDLNPPYFTGGGGGTVEVLHWKAN